MPTFTIENQDYSNLPKKKFDPIPENEIVIAEIIDLSLEEKPVRWRSSPEDTHNVSWHFVVTEGKYAKRHLWGKTPTYFSESPKCKLRIWAQEALGLSSWPEGQELDTDVLAGKQVRLLVGNRYKQDNTLTDFVKDVLRIR